MKKNSEVSVLIKELIALGEDKEELSLIMSMLDKLDDQAQTELMQNLIRERDELKKQN